ncbi:hypothetical protein CPB84DRAFT_256680 [Gymnopilus junonius]|uniref:NACHT domain-containing protein n=1 Tax=Gymnopilus junonius TaxID=109634 RepID=A0A9P5NCZ1_GYMJU|nr:hypothetical protein CPB84DRAFT_256680 [Gymnopilus junonius]
MLEMLSNSNALISGGTFNATQVSELHIHSPQAPVKEVLQILYGHIAKGALHNAEEQYDRPKCHPDTRKAILERIRNWAVAYDNVTPVMWVSGPAGSGKSSIAQTIAEMLHSDNPSDESRLAATFVFSRTADQRNNPSRLTATIAYQLTLSFPYIREYLAEAIEKDPLLLTKSLKTQLDKLIVVPFARSFNNVVTSELFYRKLIIIDGLDECIDPNSPHDVLTALFSVVQNPFCPLRFLIASRAEPVIRDFFNQDLNPQPIRMVLSDEQHKSNDDIEIFLRSKFDDIKKTHPSRSYLPLTWPTNRQIARLVEKSSGQFIYASTVMKFIASPQSLPDEQLEIILGLIPPGESTPFADLDALYTHVMGSIRKLEEVMNIFTFLLLKGPNVHAKMDNIAEFLGLRPGNMPILLNDLHSIMRIPSDDHISDTLSLYHASLGDFLLDRTRSGPFFIDKNQRHAQMARTCLNHISTSFTVDNKGSEALKISYIDLLHHCTQSRLEDMRDDLLAFDFEAYLTLPFHGSSQFSSLKDIRNLLPSFFDWIKRQDNGNDLYEGYMNHFDCFLRGRLSTYPAHPTSFYLFTASTLDIFPGMNTLFFHVLHLAKHFEYSLDDYRIIDLNGCNFWEAGSDELAGYRKMVTDFLMDDTRAGIFHVHELGYRNLAKFCVNVLNDSRFREADPEWPDKIANVFWFEECCLDVLDAVMPIIPMDPDLSLHFYKNPIPRHTNYFKSKKRDRILDAIQSYTEVIVIKFRKSIPNLKILLIYLKSSSTRRKSHTIHIAIPSSHPISN